MPAILQFEFMVRALLGGVIVGAHTPRPRKQEAEIIDVSTGLAADIDWSEAPRGVAHAIVYHPTPPGERTQRDRRPS